MAALVARLRRSVASRPTESPDPVRPQTALATLEKHLQAQRAASAPPSLLCVGCLAPLDAAQTLAPRRAGRHLCRRCFSPR